MLTNKNSAADLLSYKIISISSFLIDTASAFIYAVVVAAVLVVIVVTTVVPHHPTLHFAVLLISFYYIDCFALLFVTGCWLRDQYEVRPSKIGSDGDQNILGARAKITRSDQHMTALFRTSNNKHNTSIMPTLIPQQHLPTTTPQPTSTTPRRQTFTGSDTNDINEKKRERKIMDESTERKKGNGDYF